MSGNSSRGLNANGTVARIATQCDGTTLLRVLEAAALRLEHGADEVNALNVYPVPDGDTGTNMLHTVRSALKYARAAEPTLPAITAAAAHGALMGARGNSGVILSQIIRGLKEAVASSETVGVSEFRKTLNLARIHAHDAVTSPAPGTMLTVTVAIEDAAADDSGDVAAMLGRIVTAADAAVTRTQQENPTNKAAGVVDAGAKGLFYLLVGAYEAVAGARGDVASVGGHASPPVQRIAPDLTRKFPVVEASASSLDLAARASLDLAARGASPAARGASGAHAQAEGVASWKGAYDVQFLVEYPSRAIAQVRREMEEFGADCVLVVGDESVMKVHVHTLHPDQIIRIGLSTGRVADVVVEDLDAMTAEHERATGIVLAPPKPTASVGVLAIVPGAGFASVAVSLGAIPLRGGATMNPSTEDILTGIREVNARHVIVLPNDKNIILAAESAAKLADVPVTVIHTRNVGQGMAALVAFDPEKEAGTVAREMREVAERAHGIEVTRAIRKATIDGQDVREGEAIALIDGRLVAHADDEVVALVEAAKRLSETEVFTLYSGADVDASRVEYAAQRLRASCPRAAVEVVSGGQAHYPFIVAAE